MAKQTLNTIKSWFRTGIKRSQQQYWDVIDSFWHKDKKVPISAIDNLDTRLAENVAGLNNKVDKVVGKGLSSKDFTTIDQAKLAGLQTGATANQTDAYLINRANHTGTQQIDTVIGLQGKLDQKADLVNGKVPSFQLPAFIDDVLSYSSSEGFPSTGETGKIYIAENANKIYRWNGTAYSEFSAGAALGDTSTTAYRGDRGKTAYDHSQLTYGNPHHVSKSELGLSEVDNTSDANKPVSTAMQTALNTKVPAMSRGSIAFSEGTNLAENNANLFWDNTNKRLGVGIKPSAATLEIYSDSPTSDIAKFSGSGREGGVLRLQSTNIEGYSGINILDNTGKLSASFQYGNASAGSFTNQFVIASRKSTTPVAFWTVSSGTSIVERMRIQPITGNVGIATTSPSEKLDINGNIKCSSLAGTGDRFVVVDSTGILKAGKNLRITVALTTPFVNTTNVPANVTGWAIPVTAGKQYRIEIIADYQTASTTTGCTLMFNLASGAGTIKGSLKGAIANTSTVVGVATDLTKTVTAVSGTTNSGIQTSGVSAINTPHYIGGTVVFQCTASGTLNLNFASEVNSSSAQLNKGSILLFEEI